MPRKSTDKGMTTSTMDVSNENKMSALKLWAHIRAWFRMNTALSVALRKGEEARAEVVKEGDPFVAEIAWAFEMGVQLKPLWEKLNGPAKAMLAGWLLKALMELLKNIKIG